MIEYASQQAQQAGVEHRVSFLTMDALVRLDFPDAQFDLVNLRYGMSFVRTWDWRMIIGEMARVTRPGGILRLSEVDVVFESTSPALTQPIVEAANRLAREGLLVVRPRVGTFVRQLSRQDVHDILEARLMMELFAVSHAQPEDAEIQELYSYIDQMDILAYQEPFDYLAYNTLDIQFHRALIRLAHNPLIAQLYDGLHAQYIPARAFYRNARMYTLYNYGEHRRIIDALAHGDTAGVRIAVETHIKNVEIGIMQVFQNTAIL